MSDLRDSAAEIVAEIADRMRDPATVVVATKASGKHGKHVDVDGVESEIWAPQSLSHGYPAVSLLFAELGYADDSHRAVTHEYLKLAAQQTEHAPVYGILEGFCAVAAAVRTAAQDEEDYATLLGRLDAHVIGNARRLTAVQELYTSNREPTRPVVVDGLTGLTGLGRYLLGRPGTEDALHEVLTCLSALRQPIDWHGTTVPGWWYHKSALLREVDADAFEYGAGTFGLSHGVAGPLALFALAWEAGHRVPGHEAAARELVEWMLEWRARDAHGYFWPAHMPLTHYRDRSRDQPPPALVSWCHGSWGTAHAIALAGRAFGEPEWTAAATEVVHQVLDRCAPQWITVKDNSLCHGWAGVLYQLSLFGRRSPDPELSTVADDVARKLIANFREDSAFGYQYLHPTSQDYLDMPGLLEGATGIALVLSAYANDRPPASGWDNILMLS